MIHNIESEIQGLNIDEEIASALGLSRKSASSSVGDKPSSSPEYNELVKSILAVEQIVVESDKIIE